MVCEQVSFENLNVNKVHVYQRANNPKISGKYPLVLMRKNYRIKQINHLLELGHPQPTRKRHRLP